MVCESVFGPAFRWTMPATPAQRRLTSSLFAAPLRAGSNNGARIYGLLCVTVLRVAASSSPRDPLNPPCFHFSQSPVIARHRPASAPLRALIPFRPRDSARGGCSASVRCSSSISFLVVFRWRPS
jgi:hypothetical protein